MATEFSDGSSLVRHAGMSLAGRLSARELRRRLWHMLPGLLPFVLWFYPHRDPISPILSGIILAVVAAVALGIYICFQTIRRSSEIDHLAAILGYSLSVLLTLLLFPAHAELGLTVLAIHAFGDGSATLGGLLFQSRRLLWNPDKSWSGLVCFVVFGLPMASIVYRGETHNAEAMRPGVSPATAIACVTPSVLAAALFESLRSRLNDNIRVGIVSAVLLVMTHAMIVGL